VGGDKLCLTGLYAFGWLIVRNWTVYFWGAMCLNLYCIGLGGKLFGSGMYRCGSVQIMWNWAVKFWGANCMEQDSIGSGGKLF
jgi:hypothetical protein